MRSDGDRPRSSGSSVTIVQQIIAASSGAVVTSLTMTPLDVVKIRLQQQAQPFVKGTCFLYHNGLMDHICTACADSNGRQPCEWFLRPGNFTGTLDAFVKISKNEGVLSLWSGLSPTLVMAVPATVFYYAVYDNLLLWLRTRYTEDSLWLPMFAGGGARALSTTIVSPLEIIRTKMQSERLTYTDIGEAISRTVSIDGWSGFWRGWAPTIMRDLPFSVVYWTNYEYLKAKFRAKDESKLKSLVSFICGAVSGAVAAFVTTPFDVVKTHRQITFGDVTPDSGQGKNSLRLVSKSTYGAFVELFQKRGFRSLFAGAIPRIIKISPACGIMIGFYENIKIYFANMNATTPVIPRYCDEIS